MRDFDIFLQKLLEKPSKKSELLIKGEKKKVKAMVRLTAVNYLEGDYIKVYFTDNSYLLIIPQDKEIYYADTLLGKAEGITDEMIGRDEIITYKGKEYKLASKDDYQFVKQLFVGSPLEIEGECRFSDYYPVEGPKEFLSLGWLSYNGERADLNCQIIDLKNIEILS